MSSEVTGNFEVFGDYVLLRQLAAGGMAEVFLARPTNPGANGRVVVIKRILKQIANDPVFIKMFRSEIRVTLGFNHPHTIQLHDFGEIDYQPYIAMEYIEGKSLKQIMERFAETGERIPVPTVLGLMAQATAGLSYAHRFENTATGETVNAIHRDISPHNLLVSYDGNLKVIDFGIAKAKNEIHDKTRAGEIKGKCGYLSPEQLREESLDGRSDIFSLGIVAWELLTGQRLFHRSGETELQIIQRIQQCEQFVFPPSSVNPEVPKEVDEVVLKALQKNREDRYHDAAGFQTAIRKVMRQLYPTYAYSDTAQIMRTLFENDIQEERKNLREANDQAQQILVAEREAKTTIAAPEKPGLFSGMFRGFKSGQLPNLTELRIANLEAVLKQKASTRHFFVAVLWLVSLVGIKLDERYSLLDRFFLPTELQAATEYPVERAPAHYRLENEAVDEVEALADAPEAEYAPAPRGGLEIDMSSVRPRKVAPARPTNLRRTAKTTEVEDRRVRDVRGNRDFRPKAIYRAPMRPVQMRSAPTRSIASESKKSKYPRAVQTAPKKRTRSL